MTKLYTVGPVEMYEESLEIGGQQVPYFRTDEFSQIVLETMAGMKTLLNCDEKGEIIFLTSSGTGAMEATVENCLDDNDCVLIIDGGGFGHRFVELCEIHHIKYTAVKVEYGQTLTREMIEETVRKSGLHYTALLVNIHESSTGQLYDIEMLSEYCHENELYFIVDAISSFLADPLDMQKHRIDAVIISSQKALSLAPGLSIVGIGERMLEKVNSIPVKSMYFDFKHHINDGKRGQTPFTPAVRVIIELHQRVLSLVKKGYTQEISDVKALAEDFRRKVKEIGLEVPVYPISNALTPVIFPKNNASEVYKILKEKYHMVVNPTGGALGNSYFRVAHIGKHSIADNDELISAIKEILGQ
ncbi:MAG: pyridoxal-phosphate-dependent aminotransferase family protein [Longibaculum sp.]